jgi:hypothetical protein
MMNAYNSSRHVAYAVPLLVAGLSQLRPGFNHGSVQVKFVVDEAVLGRFSQNPSIIFAKCQFSKCLMLVQRPVFGVDE